MHVLIPAELSYTGRDRYALKSIDACIAPIVRALNDAGMCTVSLCCGHGKVPGVISLLDGREIFIKESHD